MESIYFRESPPLQLLKLSPVRYKEVSEGAAPCGGNQQGLQPPDRSQLPRRLRRAEGWFPEHTWKSSPPTSVLTYLLGSSVLDNSASSPCTSG